ncbi:hypothetical protein [Seonamhaeicola sp. ML3]|uniref:hypothetical protein n=1 Tax=Seonamhaeicola sp. ML3 TaxID=2937786 RepID=UPI00200F0EAA|nr:hypothetical protein [Seonamhaeicola sp. ML3]
MDSIKRLLNFYINSSVHVALAVVSLVSVSFLEFALELEEELLLFVFFASVTGYNFVKYFGIAKFHHRSLTNWLKTIQVFSFFAFLLMLFYAVKLPVRTLLFFAGFGLVTFFYAIPFLPKHFFVDKKQNLRSIGGLKIYLIALVWSGVTVLVPVLNANMQIEQDVIITLLQRYIFVIVLMFPFEIRDLRFDNLKLSTIPQRIGVKKTKIIGTVLVVLIVLLEFMKDDMQIAMVIPLILISIITTIFIWLANTNQSKYYSALWVEGIPIYWLALILMFR